MKLTDLLKELNKEVEAIALDENSFELAQTTLVPRASEEAGTGVSTGEPGVGTTGGRYKLLKSCVLYAAVKKSPAFDISVKPKSLARLYHAFRKSIDKAAVVFRGHVRSTAGNRLMVVFDNAHCFKNAINTAILINTISKHILSKHFKAGEIKCGIGIDYGNMLVAMPDGPPNPMDYRQQIWSGSAVRTSFHLADSANEAITEEGIAVGFYYPMTEEVQWEDVEIDDFLNNLESTFSPVLKYKDSHFSSFERKKITYNTLPILITNAVFEGLSQSEEPNNPIIGHGWKIQKVVVPGYTGGVLGADVIFSKVHGI